MITRKCVLATLAAFVTMYALGYAIYEWILGSFMAENVGTATGVMRDPPSFLHISLGQLAGAGLLATVLSWKGVKSAMAGARAGAVVGLLLAAYYGFMMLGTTNTTTMEAVFADVVGSMVMLGGAGAVVAVVMGRGGD